MMSRALCLASMLALSIPTTAHASAPPLNGPWVVGYEDGMCLLQRQYGTAAKPVTLSLRQVPTDRAVRIFLVDHESRIATGEKVRIGFGGSSSPVEADLSIYRAPASAERYSEVVIDRGDLNRATAGGALTFDAGTLLEYRLAAPGIGEALAQVDACIVDQLKQWGLSEQAVTATAQFPQPRDEIFESNDGFILASSAINGTGRNVAFVEVDSNGHAQQCKVAMSSGSREIDQASCDVLVGVRYRPALNRAGEQVPSLFAHAFRWRAAD